MSLVFSLECGFKNSGMTHGKAGKITLAVRSSHGLEVPLTDENGQLLVDENYFRFLISKANMKMEKNVQMHSKLKDRLKEETF